MFSRKDPKGEPTLFELLEKAKGTAWPQNLRMPLPEMEPGQKFVGKIPDTAKGILYLALLYKKEVEETMVKAKWAADPDEQKSLAREMAKKSNLSDQLIEMMWIETRAHIGRSSDKPIPDQLTITDTLDVVEINDSDDLGEMLMNSLRNLRMPPRFKKILDELKAA